MSYVHATKSRGKIYHYFRPPQHRKDLAHLRGLRLPDDPEAAIDEAARLAGTFRVTRALSDQIARTWAASRSRCKKAGIPHTLTVAELVKLYELQAGRCAVSGIYFSASVTDAWRQPFSPSLDRIVPRLGYVPGNVRWVCFSVNLGMSDWGEEIYRKVCAEVVRHSRLVKRPRTIEKRPRKTQ